MLIIFTLLWKRSPELFYLVNQKLGTHYTMPPFLPRNLPLDSLLFYFCVWFTYIPHSFLITVPWINLLLYFYCIHYYWCPHFPSLCPSPLPLSPSLWPSPRCCLCLWVMYVCSLANTLTFFHPVPPTPQGTLTFCDSMEGPEIIMLSEISHLVKDKYHMISLICRTWWTK